MTLTSRPATWRRAAGGARSRGFSEHENWGGLCSAIRAQIVVACEVDGPLGLFITSEAARHLHKGGDGGARQCFLAPLCGYTWSAQRRRRARPERTGHPGRGRPGRRGRRLLFAAARTAWFRPPSRARWTGRAPVRRAAHERRRPGPKAAAAGG